MASSNKCDTGTQLEINTAAETGNVNIFRTITMTDGKVLCCFSRPNLNPSYTCVRSTLQYYRALRSIAR